MQQFWVVIHIVAMIMAATGHVQDLRIDVTPMQTRFAAVQKVNVILKYSNMGDDTMGIYKWYLPESDLYEPVFEVTRNGERVEYVGPLVKRRAPTADDVIFLTPGTTVSAVIDVSSVYDMTKTGNYMIQFKTNADRVLITMDDMLKRNMPSSNGGQETVLQSAPIVVFAVGHRNQLIEQAIEARTHMRALTPSYISCTAAQSSSIRTAITSAESYANNALQYLNGQATATARYTTWFGTYLSANWATLKSHFTKIQSALSTKTLSFDCSCPMGQSGTYAYVYANMPYKIYLCGQFWPSVATGTDSKAGTLIHEIAHFTVAAGTDDHAYGQTSCKALAKSSPSQALRNSDNLQYFSENNPKLN